MRQQRSQTGRKIFAAGVKPAWRKLGRGRDIWPEDEGSGLGPRLPEKQSTKRHALVPRHVLQRHRKKKTRPANIFARLVKQANPIVDLRCGMTYSAGSDL